MEKMDFAKLTALLDMEVGKKKDDGHGGQVISWTGKTPVWGAVRQRLMPKTGPWEGGQAPVMLAYEVVLDAQIPVPPCIRFRWQRHYLRPVAPPAPWVGGVWKSLLCHLEPAHDEPSRDEPAGAPAHD